MANFILLIAIVLGGASFVSFTATNLGADGPSWASDVCLAAPLVCQSPQPMVFATAGFAALWIAIKLVSALRD
jgi:hypothetical protein